MIESGAKNDYIVACQLDPTLQTPEEGEFYVVSIQEDDVVITDVDNLAIETHVFDSKGVEGAVNGDDSTWAVYYP